METKEYENLYTMEGRYWWYKGLHHIILSMIVKKVNSSHLSILDAGCGTGFLMEQMKPWGHVKGLDASDQAIQFCQKRGLSDVSQANLNTVELKESSFDLITCVDVLYHKAIQDDVKVLKKFYGALKEGGHLILHLPAFNCLRRPHDLFVHGIRRYRYPPLQKVLSQLGFKVRFSSYRLPWLFLLILLRNTIPHPNDPTGKSDLKSIPAFLNWILFQLVRFENSLVASGLPMPFGSSLLVVVTK